MKESNNTAVSILDFLEELYPDRLPVTRVSDFELGILIGQRQLIEMLKVKLKLTTAKDIEEK